MQTRTALIVVLAVFAGAGAARLVFHPGSVSPLATDKAGDRGYPARIVSLAPSITETLFALGVGGRVVGVTRYCDYPPETAEIPAIGGFLDPNYEAIVRLDPDVVALLAIHDEARQRLERLRIPTVVVDHRTVDGILSSIGTIGVEVGTADRAQLLVAEMRHRFDRVHEKTEGVARPRVLLSSARELGTGRIESVYAAGRGQWYDELIEFAGGENAYPDDGIAFPQLTPEGVLRLDPDLIVELAPELHERPYTEQDLVAEWKTIPGLRAVEAGRVHVLAGDHVSIPGPRIVEVLEDLARAIHPELYWDAP